MARILGDFVTGFEEYTATTASPMRFRTWGGIACLAGVLERKRWVHTAGSNLYPNIYTFLVAPPGVGKSRVLELVRKLWLSVPDQFVAPSSVTRASLADELRDAHKTIIRPRETPPTVEYNSLKVLSSELGVLLPEFANDFMNTLTDLYDGTPYGESRRTKELKFYLEHPQLNLLAGTTPSYLNNLLPDGAWDQGFLSRTIIIFEGQAVLQSLFSDRAVDLALGKALVSDLKSIANGYGELTFSEEAAKAVDEWYLSGCQPAPDHPKLQHYLTRRAAHVLKLCMIACISEGESTVITHDHFIRALGWLVEAESFLPDVFKSMVSGGDGKAIEECWHFAFQYRAKFSKPVPEAHIFRFLQTKVPAHSIERVILIMVKGGVLREEMVNKIGKCYHPMEKHSMS